LRMKFGPAVARYRSTTVAYVLAKFGEVKVPRLSETKVLFEV